MILPTKLAFVDIETTGTRSMFDRVIEIGILRVEDGKIIKEYNSLINPHSHIPPEITQLTGITEQDIANAPTFREIMPEILSILGGCVFVAHNVRFDYSFLKGEFRRNQKSFQSKHFCTVKLSRHLFPKCKRHNLDSLIERFGFSCENRHRALDDARVIAEFYLKMQNEIPEKKFTTAMKKTLSKPSLPIKLTEDDLESLPELPGVYIFYGNGEIPLYIGKSKNIKARVLSHFSSDITRGIEMRIAQQIERIETVITAGELGALFAESQLIKKMLPLYNRMLRLKQKLTALRTTIDKTGYTKIVLETVSAVNPLEISSFVGFFRSKKQAKEYLSKLAKEYHLCGKLLGLESTSLRKDSSCFGYRLEQCKGACIQEEDPLFYNLRVTTAFFKTKIRPWPFPGPICIKEENNLTDITEYYIVDHWCYLGSIKKDAEEQGIEEVEKEFLFDLDNYKIIERYIKNPAHMRNIRLLTKEEQSALAYSAAFL